MAKERVPESEKVTINLGYVDLGRIDLLVQDGFYANRTDFIRTALRNQLALQDNDVRTAIGRRRLELGLVTYTRVQLEKLRDAGEMIDINVVGLATLADDVTADLARATIRSVTVLGLLQTQADVRVALADRIR